MIDVAAPPEAPVPADGSRVWRIVAMIVAFQVVIVLAGIFLFSGIGLANEGVGSCGGG